MMASTEPRRRDHHGAAVNRNMAISTIRHEIMLGDSAAPGRLLLLTYLLPV